MYYHLAGHIVTLSAWPLSFLYKFNFYTLLYRSTILFFRSCEIISNLPHLNMILQAIFHLEHDFYDQYLHLNMTITTDTWTGQLKATIITILKLKTATSNLWGGVGGVCLVMCCFVVACYWQSIDLDEGISKMGSLFECICIYQPGVVVQEWRR